jgi:hypothetical protein
MAGRFPIHPAQTSALVSLWASVTDGIVLNNVLLGLVFCDQSAVAVRIGAGLAVGEFALLSRLGTASRTMYCECLSWAGFFFHGEIIPQGS